MHNNSKQREQTFLVLIFFYVMFIMNLPLLNNACIVGHDLGYHLLRIESLKTCIQIGKPFLKINTLFLNNVGYASSLFYPDIFLYFPAILRILGFSIAASYNLFLILCNVLCYASTYYCSKLITKSSYTAVIASIVYSLCQYHIHDIYIRSAVGEITAFIFIPFIMYGIFDVLYNGFQKPWIMAIGFLGIMLSHTSTLIICLTLYFIIFIFHYKTFINDPKLLYKLSISALIVLLITAFYWMPVIEQISSDKFGFIVPWVYTSMASVDIATLFSANFTGMGTLIFVLCYPRLFINNTDENSNLLKFADECLSIGILSALMATKLFPWGKIDNYVEFLQFPWRLYIVSSLFIAVSIAIYFEFYTYKMSLPLYSNIRKVKSNLLIFIILFMSSSILINYKTIDFSYALLPNDYYDNIQNTTNIGKGAEWLPLRSTDLDAVLKNSNIVKADNGQSLPFKRVYNTILVDCSFNNIKHLDIPFIYYKGYSAYLTSSKNEIIKLHVTGEGENGFCRVKLPSNQEGKILIEYEGTMIQNVSSGISLIVILIILIFFYYNKLLKKNKMLLKLFIHD